MPAPQQKQSIVDFLFGQTTHFLEKGKPPRKETTPGLFGHIGGGIRFLGSLTKKRQMPPIEEVFDGQQQVQIPEQQPVEIPAARKITREDRTNQLEVRGGEDTTTQQTAPSPAKTTQAINFYGGENAPLHQYSHVIDDATKKYDLFKNNPYLIPVISQLETGSGKNVKFTNNFLNYGIRSESINKLFSEVGVEDALRRSLKEIGKTGTVYRRFDTGSPLTDEEILDFANTYEPENADYGPNLLNGIRQIERTIGR